MIIPRWIVISLLGFSVLAVLVAGTCWWISWPKWTAQEFVEIVAHDKFEEARQMTADDAVRKSLTDEYEGAFQGAEIIWQPRSVLDFARGRHRFWIILERDAGSGERLVEKWELAARRDKILDGTPDAEAR